MDTLVIDDVRNFKFPAEYARTSAEGLAALRRDPTKQWQEVWFDHDLGGDDTIYPVVHFIEECAFYGQPIPISLCVVHTANPVGRRMIEAALSRVYTVQHVDAAEYVTGWDHSRPNPDTVLGNLYDNRR
jgi:beta-phosphoglucomutase-like phosphatase (HAD superfamily)